MVMILFSFFWRALPVLCACTGQSYPELPSYGETGPWPVGAKWIGNLTVRQLPTQVFYPGVPGSEAGRPTLEIDLNNYLPPDEQDKIPSEYVQQPTSAYADLPIDTSHGPYPGILFIHGTAGFISQSMHQVEHWVSRGFVVIACNYPGIYLYDYLLRTEPLRYPPPPPSDQVGDSKLLIEEFTALSDPRLQFLVGVMEDVQKSFAVIGHSAGGYAAGDLGDYADVLVPMAASGVTGSRVASALLLGAQNDTVVPPSRQLSGYATTQVYPKRLALVDRSGHQFCSDLCWIDADFCYVPEGGSWPYSCGIVGVGKEYRLRQAFNPIMEVLAADGCFWLSPADDKDYFLPPQDPWYFVNYLSSAVLEETLLCDDSAAKELENFAATYEYMFDYEEQLQQPQPGDKDSPLFWFE